MREETIVNDLLVPLRHRLHQNAELSGYEYNTSIIIADFLRQYHPSKLINNIGGNGLLALFESGVDGPLTFFRAELDALPIQELNDFSYCSATQNVSHKCGHDGHMAIVAGLAPLLQNGTLKKGKVGLLFQPSEETGEGALRVLKDDQMSGYEPDFIFALHNLPGFPEGKIYLKNGPFAAASVGVVIELEGKTSHAAFPENAVSPTSCVGKFIQEFNSLQKAFQDSGEFVLITIIHVEIGEVAFGTTPGSGKVMLTVRAFDNEIYYKAKKSIENIVEQISTTEKLNFSVSYTEEFKVTVNRKEATDLAIKASEMSRNEPVFIKEPFRWSEDFGYFTDKYNGMMFGLGAGTDHPQLHNPDYDFPDEILINGLQVFHNLIKLIHS